MTTPDGPFWELVKAEIRATWCGRWRWLWWLLALSPMGIAAYAREDAIPNNLWLALLSLPVYWAPLVLGSDLFATHFKGNPEPGREWPPRAFLARGLARVLPVCVPIAASHLLVISRWHSAAEGISSVDLMRMMSHVCACPLLFVIAALVGSSGHRPRRMLISVGLQGSFFVVGYALGGSQRSAPSRFQPVAEWLSRLTTAAYEAVELVGSRIAGQLVNLGALEPQNPGERVLFELLMRFWMLVALAWWLGHIARRRYLARPYSVTSVVESP